MFFSRATINDKRQDAEINEIQTIREGDEALRSQFIKKHTNYILSMANKIKGRYIQIENDEEYPIALDAFNRAIDCYDPEKGASFLTFAGILIRRAIIDLYRKNNTIQEIAISQLKNEEDSRSDREMGDLQEPGNVEQIIRSQEDRFNLRQEITIYKALLMEYSIDFDTLVNVSPKQDAVRRKMIRLAKSLSEDPATRAFIQRRKILPLKKIEGKVSCSRKTLERHRKYILANFILINSDLDYLKDYIKDVLQEGEES